jgi:hypothetical protein
LYQLLLEEHANLHAENDPHVTATHRIRAKIALADIAAIPDDHWELPADRDSLVAQIRNLFQQKLGWSV